MKRYTSYLIIFTMCAGMLLTMAFGYREIGSKLIGAYRDIKRDVDIFEKINGIFAGIESGWNSGLYLKSTAVDIYGGIQKLLGNKVIRDKDENKTVLIGSDGKLYYAGNVTGSDSAEARKANIERLSQIQSTLTRKGVDFLFVIAPSKYCSAQVRLPMEVHDPLADTIETGEQLTELGVHHLNLHEKWFHEADVYSDGFFNTDHHWTIETAFWGFGEICKALNEYADSRIPDNYYSAQNYTKRVNKQVFLGSMGVRTGRYYAGMDDVAVITPSFPTDFLVEYETKTLHTKTLRSGDFENAVLAPGVNDYNMYITSDNPLIHVDNCLITEGKRILLVKDSFGVPVAAWLSCIADELYVVDLRYAQDQSVYDYIDEYSIDTVIMLYNAGMLGSEYLFQFDASSAGI